VSLGRIGSLASFASLGFLRLFGIAVLICLLPAAAWGARRDAAPDVAPAGFGETVDVRVVNVEAVVTDRDGNRVPGLGAEDFRLEVDGQQVPIEYFAEIRGGDAIAPATPGEKNGWLAVPGVVPGQPIATSYLVFIDEYFAMTRDRDLALERLRTELPALGPEDRMAIVAYDGDRVTMLSSWSQSPDELDSVLRGAATRPTQGFQRFAERRSFDLDRRLPAAFRFRRSVFDLTPQESFYARLLADQVERVTMAAASTARGFAGPPGRKVMLMLSGGWPFDPVRFAVDNSFSAASEPSVAAGADLYRPLTDTVNLLGYTLYTVDLAGNQSTGFDGSLALLSELDSPRALSFIREQELHAALDFLARETGGRALTNALSEEPFAAAVADTRSYYWLGFTPDRQGDDRSHAIKVSLDEPGLRLRSRRDYFDYSRGRELSLAVESALLFGHPLGPEPLEVRAGVPRFEGRGRMVLPLTLVVPADAVAFVPSAGGFTAHLELRVAALDDAGASAEAEVIPVTLVSHDEPAPGATFTYTAELRLRRRPHDMIAVLHDPATGALMSSALRITPPAPST
jgi:VWFA-related protein